MGLSSGFGSHKKNGKSKGMDLGKDSITSLLLKFSIPAIIGMMVQSMYIVINRVFIGQFVGKMEFSSLTVAIPLNVIVLAIGMLIGLGSAALISISLGRKQIDEAEKYLSNGLFLAIVFGIIFTVIGLIFLKPILVLFGASNETLPFAYEYMFIIISATLIQVVAFSMNHMLRASGRPNLAMISMLSSAILNILLDVLFILVFKWGIQGAALATVIAQFVSMVWILFCFFSKNSALRIRLKYFRLDVATTLKTFSIGVAPFATQAVGSVIGIIMNRQIVHFGNDVLLGSLGIINTVSMFFLMPVFGLNQGSQPVIGYNYGAVQYDRVKKAIKATLLASFAFCTFGWLAVEIFPTVFIKAFSSDSELFDLSVAPLRIFLICLPLIGPQIIGTVFFQAIGKAKISLILNLSRQCIFLIPLLFIVPAFLGLKGVWIAVPISDALSAVLTLFILKRAINGLSSTASARVPTC